jgi:hypothetical protein
MRTGWSRVQLFMHCLKRACMAAENLDVDAGQGSQPRAGSWLKAPNSVGKISTAGVLRLRATRRLYHAINL